MNFWRVAADAVVLAHAAYVGFVVLGFAAILIGAAAGWRWVRNFYFRAAHLLAIALVLAEALLGEICPLTALENRLRERVGQAGYPGDFIAYWMHWLIFYDWPPWAFTVLYAGFTIAVIAALWLMPPRLPWRANRGNRASIRLPD